MPSTIRRKGILLTEKAWLDDGIIDATQILICKALGNKDLYKSFKLTKEEQVTFQSSFQRAHPAAARQNLSLVTMPTFCSNGRVQVFVLKIPLVA